MIETGQTLLIAKNPIASQLAGRLTSARCVRCGDSYDALLKMSRRRWPAIVLAAPAVGFAGLCCASRRLQREAKLFAICPPASEPDVRPLAGEVLDDYFIYPPTDSEIRLIARAAAGAEMPTEAGKPAPVFAALSTRDYADMVAAAQSISDLESHIASAVGRQLGCKAAWVAATKAPADARSLLLAAGDMPRVLTTSDYSGELDGSAHGFLAAVQDCLPALIATARRTERLHRLAITDFLTGAYNRRYFYRLTDQILARGKSDSFRVSLLLFDIDDFKRYNDTYGHATGDEILREVARLMQRTTRTQDIVARIGGDEFAVLFWDNAGPRQADSAPPSTALMMAERFRRVLIQHEFGSLGTEAHGALTISGGLSTFPAGGNSCRELLRSADRALRAAKESGKNAIHLIGG